MLVEHIQAHACQRGDARAYRFLGEDGAETGERTFAAVDARARRIAAALLARTDVGARALMLLPLGLDYLDAFLGCLYSGIVAVPLYEPQESRRRKLAAVASNARPALVLADSRTRDAVERFCAAVPALSGVQVIAVDEIAGADTPPPPSPPSVSPDRGAYIQYTAGSTGVPKGVLIRQANLADNLALLQRRLDVGSGSVGVSWLPMYHDMGLVVGALLTLYAGGTSVLMSPTTFVQRPVRWLQALSRYRGEVSAAPNFAYALCCGKISPAEREPLDLRNWRIAINGAEPVNPATLERFFTLFARAGLRRQTLCPGYGLAECTVAVSVKGPEGVFPTRTVSRAALRMNALAGAPSDSDSTTLVGCGPPLLDVAIVDPESSQRCGPDTVGEIWVRGESVASAYFGQEAESEPIFRARLDGDGGGGYLRTGDLGFLYDGHLFITGRRKDLLIIRGRNHYPSDLELTAQESHPALRPVGVAFSVNGEEGEEAIIVQEVRGGVATEVLLEIASAIRRSIVREHEIRLRSVVLVAAGNIPKTTSGKVQRGATRAAFLDGNLDVLHVDTLAAADDPDEAVASAEQLDPKDLATCAPARRGQLVLELIRRELAGLLQIRNEDIDVHQSLADLGVDSLRAGELKGWLDLRLGVEINLAELFGLSDVRALATVVLARMGGGLGEPGAAELRS